MHLKGKELPVFLQSIQAASLVCVQSKLFKIIIHVLLELLLQSITATTKYSSQISLSSNRHIWQPDAQ